MLHAPLISGLASSSARASYPMTFPVASSRLPLQRPVTASVPIGRRKRRMCGSGLQENERGWGLSARA